jgi:hypothetical protein
MDVLWFFFFFFCGGLVVVELHSRSFEVMVGV